MSPTPGEDVYSSSQGYDGDIRGKAAAEPAGDPSVERPTLAVRNLKAPQLQPMPTAQQPPQPPIVRPTPTAVRPTPTRI